MISIFVFSALSCNFDLYHLVKCSTAKQYAEPNSYLVPEELSSGFAELVVNDKYTSTHIWLAFVGDTQLLRTTVSQYITDSIIYWNEGLWKRNLCIYFLKML